MEDLHLEIGTSELDGLMALRQEKKFLAEDFYPGAPTESLRIDAESQINGLLDRMLEGLAANARKRFVMSEFEKALGGFTQSDTEERERFCGYLEEIMDIIGIESSDGLLNSWLYGFDPGGA